MTRSSVQVALIARARDFSVQGSVEGDLREQAYRALIDNGIPLPVERRVVHLDGPTSTSAPAAS